MAHKSLVGNKYNMLTVIEYAGSSKAKKRRWLCSCECGGTSIVTTGDLNTGNVRSCGCLLKVANITHGMSRTKIHGRWLGMRTRCHNKKSMYYNNYGGRGIFVCSEWRHDFSAFYEWFISNGGDESLEIDRINNNLGYSPENCRLVTRAVNNNNRRERSSASGVQGVRERPNGRWQAYKYVDGTQVHIGTFSNKEEAIKAKLNK